VNLTEQQWAEIQRRTGKPTAAPVKLAQKRGMNKWEGLFAAELEARRRAGEVSWWAFETLRFRLADGAWYKPDFAVMVVWGWRETPALELYEVKGHWREAARVRIKVAADRHPFRFVAVTRKDGEWQYETIPGLNSRP
jgi:hypothetical protein